MSNSSDDADTDLRPEVFWGISSESRSERTGKGRAKQGGAFTKTSCQADPISAERMFPPG